MTSQQAELALIASENDVSVGVDDHEDVSSKGYFDLASVIDEDMGVVAAREVGALEYDGGATNADDDVVGEQGGE